MEERRWPWVVSGLLFVAAGGVSGVAAYLWSLPCADAVLPGGRDDMSFACVKILDGSVLPPEHLLVTRVQVAALVLLGLGWLAVLIGGSWTRESRWMTTPLAVMVFAQAGLLLVGDGFSDGVYLGAMWLTDVAAIAAACGVLVPTARPRLVLLGILAVCAAGSAGLVAWMVDYLIAFWLSGSYWEDNPPGTGYLLAIGLLAIGFAILALSRSVGAKPADRQADQVVDEAVSDQAVSGV